MYKTSHKPGVLVDIDSTKIVTPPVIIYYRKSTPRVIINQKIITNQRKWWFLWKGDKVTGSQYLLANNDLPKILSVIHWQVLITYIFSVSLKFWTCYIRDQWRDFTGNNATLYLHILSWRFFDVFHQNICVHFHLFFAEVSNLRNRLLTNQKLE